MFEREAGSGDAAAQPRLAICYRDGHDGRLG